MISQMYFVTTRGDVIMNRDFRKDLPKDTASYFFRRLQLEGEQLAPVFQDRGIHFFYLNCDSFYMVATSCANSPPSLIQEILVRIRCVLLDIVGVLDEENLRQNFALVYEVIEEMLDFGNTQMVETLAIGEMVKSKVSQKPEEIKVQESFWGILGFKDEIKDKNSTKISVINSQKQDVYLDVYENITAIIEANGIIRNIEINGIIKVKSYIQRKIPINIFLDSNISIEGSQKSGVILDHYSFSNNVMDREFELNRSIVCNLSLGSHSVMCYKVEEPNRLPIKIFPILEENQNSVAGKLLLKLSTNYEKKVLASFVNVKIAKTSDFTIAPPDLQNHHIKQSFNILDDKFYIWDLSMVPGKENIDITLHVTKKNPLNDKLSINNFIRKLILDFQIDNYLHSGVSVRKVRILDKDCTDNGSEVWMRYITKQNSYCIRMPHIKINQNIHFINITKMNKAKPGDKKAEASKKSELSKKETAKSKQNLEPSKKEESKKTIEESKNIKEESNKLKEESIREKNDDSQQKGDKTKKTEPDEEHDQKSKLKTEPREEIVDNTPKEIPVEEVRKHILQHYGISAEEEKEKKEKRANKFREYVQNSGLQLAFQLVISEILANNIEKDQVFKYANKRFKEIGKEYSEIVQLSLIYLEKSCIERSQRRQG